MREMYEPFNNVEEVWFWFCHSLQARGDGLRSKSDYPGKPRNCEIGDICRVIKLMKFHQQITNRHLRIMAKWGNMGVAPYYNKAAKRSEVRVWEYGMGVLNVYLQNKGIL